ncbi:MAG TPA: hypothetical protein VMT27_03490 [Actinomycetes bacterium]|nr:hypothetical protein [Actinomycetes bacterium]
MLGAEQERHRSRDLVRFEHAERSRLHRDLELAHLSRDQRARDASLLGTRPHPGMLLRVVQTDLIAALGQSGACA